MTRVKEWDRELGELYRSLGLLAVALAEADRRLDARRAADLRAALAGKS